MTGAEGLDSCGTSEARRAGRICFMFIFFNHTLTNWEANQNEKSKCVRDAP